MAERHSSSLLAEMERVKCLRTLTPEARKVEVRRHIYSQLKEMEMVRRERVALEAEEKCRREREEREEQEKRANEQKALEEAKQRQLKQERLQWQKVMLVEQPLKRPRYSISALKEEQQRRRREELELCSVPEVGAKPKLPTSNKKAEQQVKKTTLYNNWVGEQKTDREPVKEKLHPNSSIYALFAAKQGPEPEEKAKSAKPSGTLHWMQERLKVGFWVDKYQDHKEKKKEKRRLKAEEQYAQWTTYKNSCANYAGRPTQQPDCYLDRSAKRNSILKSIF